MAIPASALDVLSLAAARHEFRLEADDTEHDAEITRHIAAAVQWVERHTRHPILRLNRTLTARARGANPIRFRCRGAQRLVNSQTTPMGAVKYWTTKAAMAAGNPDGGIALANLGRNEIDGRPWYSGIVYPPLVEGSTTEREWPEAANNLYLVNVETGLDVAANPGIVDAVVVLARQLWDGMPEIKPTNAVYALCAPFENFPEW